MIVVVDYGMGNSGSVLNMLRKAGVPAALSARRDDLLAAEKLVLPGVGAFDAGMRGLEERGLRPVLEEKVTAQQTPVLGICLGAQLLTRRSEEGSLPGLGWIEAETVRFRFDPAATGLKIPHMGWNDVRISRPSALFDEGGPPPRFYFVHSYHISTDSPDAVGWTHHGYEFPSVVVSGHVAGTQFHPEKSHKWGLALLRNFALRFPGEADLAPRGQP